MDLGFLLVFMKWQRAELPSFGFLPECSLLSCFIFTETKNYSEFLYSDHPHSEWNPVPDSSKASNLVANVIEIHVHCLSFGFLMRHAFSWTLPGKFVILRTICQVDFSIHVCEPRDWHHPSLITEMCVSRNNGSSTGLWLSLQQQSISQPYNIPRVIAAHYRLH